MISLNTLVMFVILPMLGLSVVLTFIRLLRGPTVADRVIALDLFTVIGVGIIAAYSIGTNEVAFLDIGVLLAVLGFLATIAFAYYIERRTRR